MKYDYDLCVIGAGSAGLTLANGAARLGLKTVLIEKNKMGGDCLNYGCVPSKTLIKSSKVYDFFRNGSKYGNPSFKVPKADGREIMKNVQQAISEIAPKDSKERYQALGVEVIKDTAYFEDKHTIKTNNSGQLTAKYIAVASGSKPRIIEIEGLKEIGYLTNENIFDLDKLPERMVFIGAGPIGVELSMAFARFGVEITIIAKHSNILHMIDPEAVEILKEEMKRLNIKILYNCSLIKAYQDNSQKVIRILNNREEEKEVRADEVVLAVGRYSDIDDLKLSNVGIDYTKKGIKVNKKMQTNVKNIYAAGDAFGDYKFTHMAGYEASIALRNIVFKFPVKIDYRAVPWVLYSDPEIASVGMSEKDLKNKDIEYKILKSDFKDNDRAVAERRKEGFIKLLVNKHDKILGAVIVGKSAGELLPLINYFIVNKIKLRQILNVIFPYPTLSEILKETVSSYYSDKIFNKTVRKILKFLFNYQGN